jgi:hypothetical protein
VMSLVVPLAFICSLRQGMAHRLRDRRT